MGKYQLDNKGKAQVARYHEKHSKRGGSKQTRIAHLREKFLQKKGAQTSLILRRPTLADQTGIVDMIAEFARESEKIPGAGTFNQKFHYQEWLEQTALHEVGLALPEGFVPAIQYVSFDTHGQPLGFLQLRLRLSDFLLQEGGHIGYAIRPSQRRKGYAKEQLRLGLQEAANKQLDRVLITCDSNNEASQKTILACGGKLENTNQSVQRYWIETHR